MNSSTTHRRYFLARDSRASSRRVSTCAAMERRSACADSRIALYVAGENVTVIRFVSFASADGFAMSNPPTVCKYNTKHDIHTNKHLLKHCINANMVVMKGANQCT